MRIDKYLSNANITKRSEVTRFLKNNIVTCNGERVYKKDFKIDCNIDLIMVNNKTIDYKEFVYYILNKPQGYICATKDNLSLTVTSLINTSYEIFPVGRLDKDTEGLVLLTNDGMLAHRLTLPKYHVLKEYYAETDNDLTNVEMKEFSSGIKILDGDGIEYITKQAKINKIGDKKYQVIISEGKYHQVKRMFAYFNCNVCYLKRLSIGPINIGELKNGEYRELNEDEIEKLKDAVK